MLRYALGVVLVIGVSLSWAAGEALPELDLAATDLPADQWSKSKVDDRNCVVLKAGTTGAVPLAVWWGASLRPPEGSCYVAQVTFKDSASAPIKVELFAGLPGRYEIHRIGGLKDDAWKTVAVPIPWDMIMRQPGTDKTEIVFSAPAGQDVAFQKITLAAADPAGDEARWEAETRAWISRNSAEKLKNTPQAAAEKPVIPQALQDKKLILFPRNTARLVLQSSAPQEGEAGAPLKMKMALNEIEPAQLGVFANGADLKQVQIALDPAGLKDQQGQALDAAVELLAAEYGITSKNTVFPQRLWPAYPVDIQQGQSHLFWINVTTDEKKSRPGSYKGKVKVAAQGLPAEEIALEVEVLPVQLLTMKEAGLYMGSCVAGLLPAHELRNLVRHNQNSINFWFGSAAPKIVKKSKAEFDLDFTIPDDVMKHAREAGIDNFVYFLGGNPYGFPDTCQLERELYRQVFYDGTNMMDGRKEYLRKVGTSPDKLLPELRPLYIQWTKKFMAHAKEQNWPEAILTPFDEPAKWVQQGHAAARCIYYRDPKTGKEALDKVVLKDLPALLKKLTDQNVPYEDLGPGGAGPWIKEHFKDSCAAIHEACPDARIYGSIHHAEPGLPFLPDIEVFCTNAIHEDAKLGDKVRAGGPSKVFWQYSGANDSSEPAAPRYNFGIFFAAYNSRGSLCWAYNFGGRFETSSGESSIYAWTTPYSVVRAPAFEGVREAWDDRRYIETLKVTAKKVGREAEATALLEELYNSAVKNRTAGGRDTVSDFWARTNDPEGLDTMRNRIRDLILKMK